MADVGPNALALTAAQPNVDLAGPLKSVAELQMAGAHSALYSAQARYQIMRQNALAQAAQARMKGDPNWMDPILMVDPEAAKNMQSFDWTQQEHTAGLQAGAAENAGDTETATRAVAGYPAVREVLARTYQAQSTAQQTQFKTNMEGIGQTSSAFLDAYKQYQKDGDKDALVRVWNEQSTRAMKFGAMSPMEYNALYDLRTPQAMQMAIQKARQGFMFSVAAKDVYEANEAARLKAEGELPSKKAVVQEEGAQRRQTQSAEPRVVGPQDIVTTADELRKQQAQPGGMGPVPGTPNAEVGPGNMGQPGADLPQFIIPKQPMGTNDPRFLKQGTDPQSVARMNDAAKNYDEVTKKDGFVAYAQRSSLNTMENMILGGRVQSNASADIREQLAGWIYAIAGGGGGDEAKNEAAIKLAKEWTGIDVGMQGALTKQTVSTGLEYARATLGAREAVAAINIALKARPQATNTREVNLEIIRMMKAGNQYAIDKMDYGNQYYQSNNHYVGSDEAFARQRSPEMYVSRAQPFVPPRLSTGKIDTKNLQPYVMYEFPVKGKITRGWWDGQRFRTVEY